MKNVDDHEMSLLTLIVGRLSWGVNGQSKHSAFWWSTGKSCEFITIVNSILASQTANGDSSTSYVINPGFGRPIMRLVERAYLCQTPIGHCTSLELFLKNFF